MFFLLKVDGKSMSPSLESGDFVIASRYYFSLKPKDLLIVKHQTYDDIIKRINKINDDGQLWLKGDNLKHSVSSEEMGWIEKSSIKGKVIWCIKKRSLN